MTATPADAHGSIPAERGSRLLAVGFDRHQVVVECGDAEVATGTVRAFAAMLRAPSGTPAGRLEVRWTGDRYALTGTDDAAGEGLSPGQAVRSLRYWITRHLIAARSDLLWLHAAAAARDGQALLIVGPGASGKSSLVTELCASAWEYLAEDALPLEMAGDRAWPFPQTPTVRLDPGEDLPPAGLEEMAKAEVSIRSDVIRRRPARVGAILFPRYRRGAAAQLEPQSPGAAAIGLLESCLNFPSHGMVAVRYAGTLVERLPALRLTFSSPAAARRLIDERWPLRAR